MWVEIHPPMQSDPHKFTIVLSPGDDGFVIAEVPDLPGCISQGSTREEALKNVQDAIQSVLDVRKIIASPKCTAEITGLGFGGESK
jgi:predicted RNase H-like HicB family nuclease